MLLGEDRSDGKKLRYFYDSEGMCGFRYYNGSAWTEYVYVKNAKGGGQILLCVAGSGWYQEWGKPARSLKPGDVVVIPPEVKHWHGAKKDSWFSHIAVEVPGENTSNEWLEPVDDESYSAI